MCGMQCIDKNNKKAYKKNVLSIVEDVEVPMSALFCVSNSITFLIVLSTDDDVY